MEIVKKPIRLLKNLGVDNIILTNSAGSLRLKNKPGTIMSINGHYDCTFKISLKKPKAIVGNDYYNDYLLSCLNDFEKETNISIPRGKYCWTTGPGYETPEEVRYLRKIGGDAVGMSTVPEIQEASLIGMHCLALSVLTNYGSGINNNLLSHSEVLENANKAKNKLSKILIGLINKI